MTPEFLLSIGFMRDGVTEGEYAYTLYDKYPTEDTLDNTSWEPCFHVVVNIIDQSIWLEAYDGGGKTLAAMELPGLLTEQRIYSILASLGQPIKIRC